MKDWVTSADLAWAAGLIDGEGCFTLHQCGNKKGKPKGPFYTPMLRVDMVHKPTIERLHELFGGKIRKCLKGPNRRRPWEWRISGRKALPTIRSIFPHMITKAEEARLVLSYENLRGTTGHSISTEVKEKRLLLYNALCAAKRTEWEE